ncbi:MAG: hypothetical protein WDN27_04895 [Candidatus Saccharibacteria bacterium]
MLRRFTATVTLIVMAGLAIPGAASAHVLKIDGSIGGVLHINPDDNPTTGNPTDYILSFDDDSGKFNLAKMRLQRVNRRKRQNDRRQAACRIGQRGQ